MPQARDNTPHEAQPRPKVSIGSVHRHLGRRNGTPPGVTTPVGTK